MADDPIFYLAMAATTLAAITIVSVAMLRAWSGWLDLKRSEIANPVRRSVDGNSGMAARIEVADLKERIRKLEAIAAGVDI